MDCWIASASTSRRNSPRSWGAGARHLEVDRRTCPVPAQRCRAVPRISSHPLERDQRAGVDRRGRGIPPMDDQAVGVLSRTHARLQRCLDHGNSADQRAPHPPADGVAPVLRDQSHAFQREIPQCWLRVRRPGRAAALAINTGVPPPGVARLRGPSRSAATQQLAAATAVPDVLSFCIWIRSTTS
jgi:hypothetical protein